MKAQEEKPPQIRFRLSILYKCHRERKRPIRKVGVWRDKKGIHIGWETFVLIGRNKIVAISPEKEGGRRKHGSSNGIPIWKGKSALNKEIRGRAKDSTTKQEDKNTLNEAMAVRRQIF